MRRKFCNASYARLGRAFFDKYPSGVLSHIICAGDEKGGVDACQVGVASLVRNSTLVKTFETMSRILNLKALRRFELHTLIFA